MALFHVLDDCLAGSVWSSALVQASFTTSGRSNSVLEGNHVRGTKDKMAHQLMATSLRVLQRAAYQ